MQKKVGIFVFALLAMSLAGCEKEPVGQVAAVVNDEEITLQEINAELASMNVSPDADREAVQKAALQRIIDRRLLAQAAREDGVDKDPEFLIRMRQAEDALLAKILTERIERGAEVPTERKIDAFIEENPNVFEQRTLLNVDRLVFDFPRDRDLGIFADDHSLAAVAERLDGLNIDYTRNQSAIDSAKLNAERFEAIRRLPAGEPFLIREGEKVMAGVVTGARAVPLPEDEAKPLAVTGLRNKTIGEALRSRLERMKSSAEIQYQPGFEPEETEATEATASGT